MRTRLQPFKAVRDVAMSDRTPQHIQTRKSPVYWDWWSESPVEIILVVFILVLFFLAPRAGCGISETEEARGQVEAPAADGLEELRRS
jgi:hypothetical protein